MNARQAAWGGYSNAYMNRDVTMAAVNPALLNEEMLHRASLNMNSQVTGVWSGNAGYAFKYKRALAAVNMAFIDYGQFDNYDAGGNPEGTTNANEFYLSASLSREFHPQLKLGANLKVVYSVLGPYVSNGVAVDLGAVWQAKDSTWSLAAVLRNAGTQVVAYSRGNPEPLPFDAQIGFNIKPKHMPFRFNLMMHNLQRFDFTYSQYLKNSGILDLGDGQSSPKEAGFGNKLLRHFSLGTELVLGKNFGILVGYNHQRRTEMAPGSRKGVTGFSWGLDFRISRFQFTYSSAAMFPGFNQNLITLTTNINDFRRKKT